MDKERKSKPGDLFSQRAQNENPALGLIFTKEGIQ